ncbi:hypothetical protein V498_02511 [Pseudogymnoascus sp. VKM F-4517 (FW-2822)]|nr:hypothetical protein V498_02511 [Pseudogymnoascus sp. VKM F-4517 (FW-2822)]
MATLKSYEIPQGFPHRVDDTFLGITPLAGSEESTVDILSISGLGGHPVGSFKDRDGHHIWLRDSLPQDIPKARVLVYGYDTSLVDPNTKSSLTDLAKTFLSTVKAFRTATKTNRRPLIFVAHSLGGLLVKEALHIASSGCEDPQNDDFIRSSYAILFFGVPNLGLRYETLQEIVSGQSNFQLIHDLLVDEESEPKPLLVALKQKFIQCCKDQKPPFKIISYYEQKKTKMVKASYNYISMTKESACSIGHTDNFLWNEPLDTDHSNLVKYSGPSDPHYLRVVEKIITLAEDAPSVIEGRFALLKELSSSEKCHWNDLNVPPYADFKDSEKVSRPVEGTLQWLINDDLSNTEDGSDRFRKDDLITWRDSDQCSNLLVTAAPGQGKSVLSNFVIDHLKDHLKKQQDSRYKVIYYFCNIKNDVKFQTASSILRALIVQLCEDQRLFLLLPNRFKKAAKEFFSASLAELWAAFDLITTDIYSRIYCVIDGLDVYPHEMDILIGYFNRGFGSQGQGKAPFFKLFCTSRPEGFAINCGLSPRRVLRASTDDLAIFVDSRLESFPTRFTAAIKEYIRITIINRAEQTFLWISIVIGELYRLQNTSPARIKKTLEAAPNDITELYTNLLQKIMDKNSDCVLILAWITFAKRPLSLGELQTVIAVWATRATRATEVTSWEDCVNEVFEVNIEWVHDNLGTLVDVINGKPYFIHQTLRDFLRDTYKWQTEIMSDYTRPELLLADISMTFLTFKEFRSEKFYDELQNSKPRARFSSFGEVRIVIKDIKSKYPFVDYAAELWYAHIQTSNEARKYIRQLEAILYEPRTLFWIHATFDPLQLGYQRIPQSLWDIAIFYNIGWLANLLLIDTPGNLSAQFVESRMASLAAGTAPMVLEEVLRHTKLKVTESLVRAAAGNKEAIIVLLQERGAEVKITENVIKAAASSRDGADILKLLLHKRGGEVKITENVIKAAASSDDGTDVLKLLLHKRGGEVKITEDVIKAAASGFKSRLVMELLLQERGAEVKITENVIKAVASSDEGADVLKLLLHKRGDEVKITEDVIKAAASGFNSRLVMGLLLQERGDEVKITEDVIKAATSGYRGKEVLELLLQERGDEVKITEDVIKAVVSSVFGSKEILELLLQERGDEVKITEDVIKAAARNRFGAADAVMELLLHHRQTQMQAQEV